MKRTIIAILGLLVIGAGLAPAQAQRPSDLTYPPLKYEPPSPRDFRIVYAGGLRAYVQPDKSLPLFNITAIVNCGDLYVLKEKTGLGTVLGDQLIKGGTTAKEGPAIEDRIDFLGGSLNFNVQDRTAMLTLSVLSKDLDEGLATFFDVLRNPAFREEPLKLAKARMIEQLRQVNDQPSTILSRAYDRLLYGDNAITWQPTKASYEGVTAADLKAYHAKYFTPRNVILAVSGDFDKAALKAKIEKLTAGWKGGAPAFPAIPKTFPNPEPGVYFVEKAINQGYISLGHLGIEDTNPDYYAVQVMNFILGGGSFTSRITTKVRSDEGLSYNQGSRFTYRWGLPGTFSGYVQTKSSTVGYAISLILNEFNRIRMTPVSDAEMETAVNFYLESFADNFQSSQTTMMSFANLEMTGKPMDYYKTYRAKIQAVTKARVQDVATKYIQPDKAVIVIVGDWEPCNKGGEKWAGPLDKLGRVHKVALTDPMTGQEIK